MSIRFRCDKCGAAISAPAAHAGKQGRCPDCKAIQAIPTRVAESVPPRPGAAHDRTSPPYAFSRTWITTPSTENGKVAAQVESISEDNPVIFKAKGTADGGPEASAEDLTALLARCLVDGERVLAAGTEHEMAEWNQKLFLQAPLAWIDDVGQLNEKAVPPMPDPSSARKRMGQGTPTSLRRLTALMSRFLDLVLAALILAPYFYFRLWLVDIELESLSEEDSRFYLTLCFIELAVLVFLARRVIRIVKYFRSAIRIALLTNGRLLLARGTLRRPGGNWAITSMVAIGLDSALQSDRIGSCLAVYYLLTLLGTRPGLDEAKISAVAEAVASNAVLAPLVSAYSTADE